MRLDVHFEFGSPYTYLTWHRIVHHPAYRAVDVRWRPMSLFHIVQKEGGRLNREMPNMARNNFEDLRRFAKGYRIPLWFAKSWPTRTLDAHRGHVVAAREGKDAAWREAVFIAHWTKDQDIGDPEVLDALGADIGIPDIMERITADVKQTVIDETEAAYAAGACGSPYLVLHDGTDHRFWGHDRLDWVEARIAGKPVPDHWGPLAEDPRPAR